MTTARLDKTHANPLTHASTATSSIKSLDHDNYNIHNIPGDEEP